MSGHQLNGRNGNAPDRFSSREVGSRRAALLEADELAFGLTWGAEVEAEHGLAIEGLGESMDRLRAGAVLAALDAGDDRRGSAHSLCEVALG